MKLLKRFSSSCLVIALLTTVLCSPAYALQFENNINSKAAFADEKDREYAAQPHSTNAATSVIDQNEVSRMQIRVCQTNDEEERNVLLKELESYGVYLYSTSSSSITPMSTESDIVFSDINFFYNASTTNWSMSMYGYWKNNAYLYDGNIGDMGDPDAFGIAFTDVSGDRPLLTGAYAYMADNNYRHIEESTTRSDGDTWHGVGFRFQDRKGVENGITQYYFGAFFGATIYFSENFENSHGYATPYYIHTWDNARIQQIKFGVSGKTLGLDITIDNGTKSFSAYGTTELAY